MKKAFTLLMLLACSMGMTWAADEDEEATTTYTHLVTMECDPAEGDTVNTLDTVLVTFPDYSSVSYSKTTYVYKEGESSYVTYCNPSQSSCDANQLLLPLKLAQTDNGKYYVVIRMGYLTVDGSLASSSEYNDSIVFYVDSTYVETETETEEEDGETVEYTASMVYPEPDSYIDSLYAGDYVKFTIEPHDNIGYAYYKVESNTGVAQTTRQQLNYEDGCWSAEVVYDKAFVNDGTDSLYYFIIAAYKSENAYNYDQGALCADTFMIHGTAEPYEYSVDSMLVADPADEDTVYVNEGSDLVCNYTFSGPVLIENSTSYEVYGSGVTYSFESIEATGNITDYNGTTYSDEWTITLSWDRIVEYVDDEWITLCVVATDTTGARVEGDEGGDNQTYFRFEYYLTEVDAADTTITFTALEPAASDSVEYVYDLSYTASEAVYLDDSKLDDITISGESATYSVDTAYISNDSVLYIVLSDTITTGGTVTVTLPAALVGNDTAYNYDFVSGNVSAEATFTYIVVAEEEETDPETGISNVNVSSTGTCNVYTLTGMHVMTTTDSTLMKSLPKGIYIVNGKKVVVK